MTRTYSVKLIALTIGVPFKWVDNLLSHYELPGVTRSRQGVERQITDEGLLAIEATRLLTTELALALGQAAAIVRAAIASRAALEMRFMSASGIAVVFPVAAIELRLRERVIEAVEALGRVPRGRPPREVSAAE